MADENKIPQSLNLTAIEIEAATWVVRHDAGDLSAKDQMAFWQWLAQCTLHRTTFMDYAHLWSKLDGLSLLTKKK
jgi:ferric-dicitrate binding protein FerR (iron transport regulator)